MIWEVAVTIVEEKLRLICEFRQDIVIDGKPYIEYYGFHIIHVM